MKRILLIILASVLLTGCEERDRDKGVNPDILPEATQKGANTAGCKVDGKVWVASRRNYRPIYNSGTYVDRVAENYQINVELHNIQIRIKK